jgi:lysozyme family protein
MSKGGHLAISANQFVGDSDWGTLDALFWLITKNGHKYKNLNL